MFEVTTDALVLDREELGEHDSRVFLYTRELGGAVARGTSMRKITSKLAASFEPLRFVRVRLLQRGRGDVGNFQIADAVSINSCPAWHARTDALRLGLKLARLFQESGFRGDADPELWEELSGIFMAPPADPLRQYGTRLLRTIGFDPQSATCAQCGAGKPTLFSIKDLVFICEGCVERPNFV